MCLLKRKFAKKAVENNVGVFWFFWGVFFDILDHFIFPEVMWQIKQKEDYSETKEAFLKSIIIAH